jgi:hypothetical protein
VYICEACDELLAVAKGDKSPSADAVKAWDILTDYLARLEDYFSDEAIKGIEEKTEGTQA